MRIGLMRVNDSCLQNNKRVPDKQAKKMLAQAELVLTQEGFEVVEYDMMQLLNKKKHEGYYLQYTLTEEIEVSKSGNELLYRVPVTTLLVWIQDDVLKHRHSEKIVLNVYEAYSELLVSRMMDDLTKLVCQRLKSRP
jgi:hypothetical protein